MKDNYAIIDSKTGEPIWHIVFNDTITEYDLCWSIIKINTETDDCSNIISVSFTKQPAHSMVRWAEEEFKEAIKEQKYYYENELANLRKQLNDKT